MIPRPPRDYPREWVKRYFWALLIETLIYLAMYLRLLVIYGAFFGGEYVIIWMERLFLADALKKYDVVARIADFAEVFLALLTILLFLVHGILGTVDHARREWVVSQDAEGLQERREPEGVGQHERAAPRSPERSDPPAG